MATPTQVSKCTAGFSRSCGRGLETQPSHSSRAKINQFYEQCSSAFQAAATFGLSPVYPLVGAAPSASGPSQADDMGGTEEDFAKSSSGVGALAIAVEEGPRVPTPAPTFADMTKVKWLCKMPCRCFSNDYLREGPRSSNHPLALHLLLAEPADLVQPGMPSSGTSQAAPSTRWRQRE